MVTWASSSDSFAFSLDRAVYSAALPWPKIWGRFSRAIPVPLSDTVKWTRSPASSSQAEKTMVPFFVCLPELMAKLMRTWSSAPLSVRMVRRCCS